jgi:hypothetical protein
MSDRLPSLHVPDQDDFDTCRTIGHAWFEVPRERTWDEHVVWHNCIVLVCERCTMERFDGIDAYGGVGQRRYRRPEGYAYAKGEMPTRSELRLAMVRRKATSQRRRRPAS